MQRKLLSLRSWVSGKTARVTKGFYPYITGKIVDNRKVTKEIVLYRTTDWHTALFTLFSLFTGFVNFHWLLSAHKFLLLLVCKMFFLKSHIFYLLPLYKSFFFLNNEFWISYWKPLKAFTLFPLCFALMNTFHQWSGRFLVPSGRRSVSAMQITTVACL